MRWVLQFVVPALVVIVIALLLTRHRRGAAAIATQQGPLSIGALFVLIVLGGALAIGLVYALQGG